MTENEENIKLDIETLTQISNQLDIIETYHSALISSQLFSVPIKKSKQQLYTLAELCLYGKAKNSFVAYFDEGRYKILLLYCILLYCINSLTYRDKCTTFWDSTIFF